MILPIKGIFDIVLYGVVKTALCQERFKNCSFLESLEKSQKEMRRWTLVRYLHFWKIYGAKITLIWTQEHEICTYFITKNNHNHKSQYNTTSIVNIIII